MGQSPLMNKVLACKPNLFFLYFIVLLVCLDCKLSISKCLESSSRTWQKWLTEISGKLQCHYEAIVGCSIFVLQQEMAAVVAESNGGVGCCVVSTLPTSQYEGDLFFVPTNNFSLHLLELACLMVTSEDYQPNQPNVEL